MNKPRRILFSLLCTLLSLQSLNGQERDTVTIHFNVNEWKNPVIETNHDIEKYRTNGHISKITFYGNASPEGPDGWNETLSLLRAEHSKRAALKFLDIPEYRVVSDYDSNSIIPISEYPNLRRVEFIIEYHSSLPIPAIRPKESSRPLNIKQIDGSYIVPTKNPLSLRKRGLLLIGTNLMYDAMGAPDLQLEYYPEHGFLTYGAEATVPWFKNDTKHLYYQLQRYRAYMKYYPITPQIFTRWYISPYLEGGVFDFENRAGWINLPQPNDKGHQGEFFGTGICGGYTLVLDKIPRLRIDFSLGLGYIHSKYREYIAIEEIYPYLQSGKMDYFGPTHIGISLMWEMILRNNKSSKQ